MSHITNYYAIVANGNSRILATTPIWKLVDAAALGDEFPISGDAIAEYYE